MLTKEIWNHGTYFDCSTVDLSHIETKANAAYSLAEEAYNLAESNGSASTTVSVGIGLTESSGTIKAKLKSETLATYDSATITNTSGRQYAVTVDKSGYLSVNVPWSQRSISSSVTSNSTSTAATSSAVKSAYDLAGEAYGLAEEAYNLADSKTDNVGTVTSIGLSVPTGLAVTGSPVTTSGTLAIAMANGYSIPTTANQTK